MALWSLVLTNKSVVENLGESVLDLTTAMLVGDTKCCVRVTPIPPTDAASAAPAAAAPSIICALNASHPNARLHVVLSDDVRFELLGGSNTTSVHLLGNQRTMSKSSAFELNPELLRSLREKFLGGGSGILGGGEDESDDGSSGTEFDAANVFGGEADSSDEDDGDVEMHPQVEELIEEDQTIPQRKTKASNNAATEKAQKSTTAPLVEVREQMGLIRSSGDKQKQLPASFGNQLNERDAKRKRDAPSSSNLRSEPVAGAKAQKKKVKFDEDTTPEAAGKEDEILGIRKKLKAGVSYELLSGGTGAVASVGKKVEVQYVGKLRTGHVFDKGSLTFVVGKGEMISGFDVGVRGMMVGEKRKIFVPSRMGYGANRVGSIPPNSDLTFEVTLKKVK